MGLIQPYNLEQLLERLGRKETPGDPRHRYALRRTILNCREFEANRVVGRWLKVMAVSTWAVAGLSVVLAVTVGVQYVFLPEEPTTNWFELTGDQEMERRPNGPPPIELARYRHPVPADSFLETINRKTATVVVNR